MSLLAGDKRALVTLATAVVAVRAAYVLLLLGLFDITVGEDYYDEIARNLVDGFGYVVAPGEPPNLFRYPGYPYALSALFRLSDDPYALVVFSQFVLDLATLGVLFLICLDVFDRTTAVVAVVLAALYPFSALYIIRYTTEPLFSFLLAAATLFFVRGVCRGGVSRFVAAGVVFGLAVLCRASLFYFLFLLPGLALVMAVRKARWAAFRATIVTVLVALLLMLPWGLRNQAITGEIDLLGTAGGYSLWVGNRLVSEGRDRDELSAEEEQAFIAEERRIAGDVGLFSPEGERRFVAVTVDAWLDQPVASFWLVLRKVYRFWFSIYTPEHRNYAIILVPVQGLLLSLAVVGVLQIGWRAGPHWYLLAMILYLNAVHAIVVATFRYSIPVMPYVMMFAGYAVVAFLARFGPAWGLAPRCLGRRNDGPQQMG